MLVEINLYVYEDMLLRKGDFKEGFDMPFLEYPMQVLVNINETDHGK